MFKASAEKKKKEEKNRSKEDWAVIFSGKLYLLEKDLRVDIFKPDSEKKFSS